MSEELLIAIHFQVNFRPLNLQWMFFWVVAAIPNFKVLNKPISYMA